MNRIKRMRPLYFLILTLVAFFSFDVAFAKCTTKVGAILGNGIVLCEIHHGGNTDIRKMSEIQCRGYCKAEVPINNLNLIQNTKISKQLESPKCTDHCTSDKDLKHQNHSTLKDSSSSSTLNGFFLDDFLAKYTGPGKNTCEARGSKEFRKSSFRVMEEALKQYPIPHFPKPVTFTEDDSNSEEKYRLKMGQLWKRLIMGVVHFHDAKFRGEYPDMPQYQSFVHDIEDTNALVLQSIDAGLIPLPALRNSPHYFGFSNLSQSLAMGISVVALADQSPRALEPRSEHPFNGSFLGNMFLLMNHDIQHSSNILAKNAAFLHFDFDDPAKFKDNCEKYQKCFDQFSKNHPKKSDPVRMAFYYMLHEDFAQLGSNSITDIYPQTFVEFAFERFLDEGNPLFSLDALLGGPARSAQAVSIETEMICFKIRKVYDTLKNDFSNAALKSGISETGWIHSQTAPFMGDFFPVSEIKTKMQKLSKSINFDTNELAGSLKLELIETLQVKCTQRGFTKSQLNDAAATQLLKSKFDQMIQHGFQKKFLDHFEESLGALPKLEKYLGESPECRGLFPFKRTP